MQENILLISILKWELSQLIKEATLQGVKDFHDSLLLTAKESIKQEVEPWRSAKWLGEKHGFSEQTIRNWYKDGRIPGHKIGNATTVFLESEFVSAFRKVVLKTEYHRTNRTI